MKVVPDSNLIVALVIPVPYTAAATRKMQQWQNTNVELVVPTLWALEDSFHPPQGSCNQWSFC